MLLLVALTLELGCSGIILLSSPSLFGIELTRSLVPTVPNFPDDIDHKHVDAFGTIPVASTGICIFVIRGARLFWTSYEKY